MWFSSQKSHLKEGAFWKLYRILRRDLPCPSYLPPTSKQEPLGSNANFGKFRTARENSWNFLIENFHGNCQQSPVHSMGIRYTQKRWWWYFITFSQLVLIQINLWDCWINFSLDWVASNMLPLGASRSLTFLACSCAPQHTLEHLLVVLVNAEFVGLLILVNRAIYYLPIVEFSDVPLSHLALSTCPSFSHSQFMFFSIQECWGFLSPPALQPSMEWKAIFRVEPAVWMWFFLCNKCANRF